jgi:monoamine oxidase
LPNALIQYPSTGFFQSGKGVLLGAYAFGSYAFEWTALSPAERLRRVLEFGAQIHPQYEKEFENGISVGWHREPATLGCFAVWSDDARKQHYNNLCALDGRIMLAGEHASYIPAGRRAPCSPRSTRSRGCIGVSSTADPSNRFQGVLP